MYTKIIQEFENNGLIQNDKAAILPERILGVRELDKTFLWNLVGLESKKISTSGSWQNCQKLVKVRKSKQWESEICLIIKNQRLFDNGL